MKTNSQSFLKRRKFYCVLPVLILPFITLAFWALGGGKNKPIQSEVNLLNKELPQAVTEASPVDKLSLYYQAEKDSTRLREDLFTDSELPGDFADSLFLNDSIAEQQNPETDMMPSDCSPDDYEKKINDRISVLREKIKSTPSAAPEFDDLKYEDAVIPPSVPDFNSSGTPDPELQQLDGMLEKLINLQNPDRLQNKIKAQSIKSKGVIFPVLQNQAGVEIDLMKTKQINGRRDSVPRQHKFIDISEQPLLIESAIPSAIAATVHESVVLVNGATIKLRLTADVFINGKMIPSGTLFSGISSITGERLKIDVTAIRYEQNILPVSLSVYDLDAIEGIRIPDAITRDAGKEGIDRAVQSVQLMNLDQSVATQAATAGVEAVKGLFGKKARLVRVTVKAGHPVLLLNKSLSENN